MAIRVGFGNHKGGSGKTSTVRNLAAALAEAGHRVLVVDLDPQANCSRRMAAKFDPLNPTLTTAEVIHANADGVAAQAIRPCGWDAPYSDLIDVIPARYDLENRVAEAGVVGAVHRLFRALDGVDDDYAYTLIDFPPSLGHLTQLGLAAVDAVVGVVEPEFDGVEGVIRLAEFVANPHNRKALDNADLRMIGYIISRVRANLGAHEHQLRGMPALLGAHLMWEPRVPERSADKDASDSEVPLRALGGRAREHADVWKELAAKLVTETKDMAA